MSDVGRDERHRFSDGVLRALATATEGLQRDTTLDSRRLLVSLERVDMNPGWARVLLLSPLGAGHVEPTSRPPKVWLGVRVTDPVATAIDRIVDWSEAEDVAPIVPAMIAVALVTDDMSSASVSMTAGGAMSVSEVVELMEDELLGRSLHLGSAPEVTGMMAPDETVATDHRVVDVDRLLAAASRDGQDRAGGLAVLAAMLADTDTSPESLGLLRSIFLDEPTMEHLVLTTDGSDHESLRASLMQLDQRKPNPTDADVIEAIARDPDADVAAALHTVGVSNAELVTGAALVAEDGVQSGPQGWVVLAASCANFLALSLAAVAVVAEATSSHRWVVLLLLPVVWQGHPMWSARVELAGALLLGWLVGALAMAAQATSALCSLVQASAERNWYWSRTAVRLTLAQQRRFHQRRHTRFQRMQLQRSRLYFLARSEDADADEGIT